MIDAVLKSIHSGEIPPTDVKYLYSIIEYIKSNKLQPINIIPLIKWFILILRSPFSLKQIISDDEIGYLINFLLAHLKHSSKDTHIALAVILNNLNCEHMGKSAVEYCLINEQEVDLYTFYGILKELSKLRVIDKKYTIIHKDDSSIIIRYKIKIISNSLVDVNESLNDLLRLINNNDSKVGWTLSKGLFKISRVLDRRIFIENLKGLLLDDIFGTEQMWINIMTVLGLLVLDGEDIEFERIKVALLHDKEFVSKSVNVRETGLFLCWCLIKMSHSIDINLVVFISLFDSKLICRRAAASIIHEFIGRKPHNTVSVSLLTLSDPNVVKRPLACFSIFLSLENHSIYKELVLDNLFHYDRTIRTISSLIIALLYDIPEEIKYKSILEKDGTHLLISHCLYLTTRNRNYLVDVEYESYCNNYESRYSIDDIILKFKHIITTFSVDKTNYGLRNMNYCLETYLRVAYTLINNDFRENEENTDVTNSNGEEKVLKMSGISGYNIEGNAGIEETKGCLIESNSCIGIDSDINNRSTAFKRIADEVTRVTIGANKINNSISKCMTRDNKPLTNEVNMLLANIIFLISKNYDYNLMYDILSSHKNIFNYIDKDLFKLINKNEAGVLINSLNLKMKQKVLGCYMNNLKCNIFVDVTIKALRLGLFYDLEVAQAVVKFMNDYTINYMGDAGYYNRKESLVYFIARSTEFIKISKTACECHFTPNSNRTKCLDPHNSNVENLSTESKKMSLRAREYHSEDNSYCRNSELDIDFEHFLIRFLTDKSRRLREFTVNLLFNRVAIYLTDLVNYNEMKTMFPPNKEISSNFMISCSFTKKIVDYFQNYSKLLKIQEEVTVINDNGSEMNDKISKRNITENIQYLNEEIYLSSVNRVIAEEIIQNNEESEYHMINYKRIMKGEENEYALEYEKVKSNPQSILFSHDYIHFKAASNVFGKDVNYIHGIINTFSTSDSVLVEVIKDLLQPILFIDISIEMIKNNFLTTPSLNLLLFYKEDKYAQSKILEIDKNSLSSSEVNIYNRIIG